MALAEKEEKAPVVGVLDKENEEISKEVEKIRSEKFVLETTTPCLIFTTHPNRSRLK